MKFLFQKDTTGLDRKHRILYWIWQGGILLLSAICLGLTVLLLGASPEGIGTFGSYFKRPLVVVLNLLPVIGLMALLYFLIGRGWIAFLVTGGLTMAAAIGNYYKILFRDDPFIFGDFQDILLGLSIASAESYDVTPTPLIIVSLLALIGGTVFLAFLVRGRIPFKKRLIGWLPALAVLIGAVALCLNTTLYTKTAVPGTGLWAPTSYYIDHGFLYPFLQSANDLIKDPPEGYEEGSMEELLAGLTDGTIPEEQKVNLMFVMREANSDLSRITDAKGIDWSVYDSYHQLQQESYSGLLFNNIFAGGTVNSERSVMTGAYKLGDFERDTNSYLYYFKAQGYTVEGSHPSYDWFYNRLNINRYLGLETYYYMENYYNTIGDEPYQVTDRLLYTEINKLFEERDTSKPYLSFNVTYQGHGPYSTDVNEWGTEYVTGDYTEATKNILNNYLGSIADSNAALMELVDYYRNSEEPMILCIFGDHMPWLGNDNTVYKELGINIDPNTADGLRNYYETEYLIWANDAAKKALGKTFTGDGAEISTCYLMNELFEVCGWQGPAFMQFMNTYKAEMPIVSSNGVYGFGGDPVRTVPEDYQEKFKLLEQMTFYWDNQFIYGT